jgi:hypothetical protein
MLLENLTFCEIDREWQNNRERPDSCIFTSTKSPQRMRALSSLLAGANIKNQNQQQEDHG